MKKNLISEGFLVHSFLSTQQPSYYLSFVKFSLSLSRMGNIALMVSPILSSVTSNVTWRLHCRIRIKCKLFQELLYTLLNADFWVFYNNCIRSIKLLSIVFRTRLIIFPMWLFWNSWVFNMCEKWYRIGVILLFILQGLNIFINWYAIYY